MAGCLRDSDTGCLYSGHSLEDEDSDAVHYVMLRAASRFHAEFNRYPGSDAHLIEPDVPKLKV